jgi:hypothetical protein
LSVPFHEACLFHGASVFFLPSAETAIDANTP